MHGNQTLDTSDHRVRVALPLAEVCALLSALLNALLTTVCCFMLLYVSVLLLLLPTFGFVNQPVFLEITPGYAWSLLISERRNFKVG